MQLQPNSSAMRTAAMYILHCWSTWLSVRSFGSSAPSLNFMPRATQPVVDRLGVGVGDGEHLGVERGLAEALLVDAGARAAVRRG